jgi:hypothetical protein
MIIAKGACSTQRDETTYPMFIIREDTEKFIVKRVNTGHDIGSQEIIKSDIPDSGRLVFFWSHYGLGLIPAPDYDDSREVNAFYMHKYGCQEGAPITVARSGDISVLICTAFCYAETDFVVRQIPGPSIDLVDEFIPGFSKAPGASKIRAKMELMRSVNLLDSIAALEKQIDLLTALVLELAIAQPENEQPKLISKISDLVNGPTSVSDFDKTLSDVITYKSRIRALQAQYFKDRNG